MVKKKSSKKDVEFIDYNPLDTMVPDNYIEEEKFEKTMQIMTPEDFKRLTDLGIGDIESKDALDEEVEIEHYDRVVEENIPEEEYITLDVYGTKDRVESKDDLDDTFAIELPSLKSYKIDEDVSNDDIDEVFNDNDELYEEEIKDEYDDLFQDIFSDEEAIIDKYESLKEYDKISFVDTDESVDLKDNLLESVEDSEDDDTSSESRDILKDANSNNDEDVEEESIDLDIDFDDTIIMDPIDASTNNKTQESITLATGSIDELESKELEDFLFDNIKTKEDIEDADFGEQNDSIESNYLENEELSSVNDNNIITSSLEDEVFADNGFARDLLELEQSEDIIDSSVLDVSNESKEEILSSKTELKDEKESSDVEKNNKIDEVENNAESSKVVVVTKQPTKQVIVKQQNPFKAVDVSLEKKNEALEKTLDKHLEENSKYVRAISKTEKIIAIIVVVIIIILTIYLIVSTTDGEKVGNKENKTTTTTQGIITVQNSTTTVPKVVTIPRQTTTEPPNISLTPNLPSTGDQNKTTKPRNTTTQRPLSPFTTKSRN